MPLYGVTSTFHCSNCGVISTTKTVVNATTPTETPLIRFLIARHFPERHEVSCQKCHKPFLPQGQGEAEISVRVQSGTAQDLNDQGFDV